MKTLENSSQRAVFIFYLFLSYGTYDITGGGISPQSITIEQCHSRGADYFVPDLLNLRNQSHVREKLKPMSTDEIVRHIHEFYLVLMGETVVGCYRLFSPDSAKDVYELGSVVSKEKGIGTIIASQAVEFARINKKKVIIITDNPGLVKILTEGNWRKATGQFPERSKLSVPGKDIYLHSGNIESPSLFS